jgi:hypothetical protein
MVSWKEYRHTCPVDSKVTRICALFNTYAGERAWKYIGDRLKGPCYLSRDDHNPKIRARKQRLDIGKYCFVNRTSNRETNFLQRH